MPPGMNQNSNSYAPGANVPAQGAPMQGQGAGWPGQGAPMQGQGAPWQAPGQPMPAPARPKTIAVAFWLLIAAAAFLIIRIPVGVAVLNSAGYAEALQASHEGTYFIVDVPGTIAARMSSMIFPPMIMAAITVLAALFIRLGHNWARIVLTVFAVLSALLMWPMFSVDTPVMPAVLMSLAAALLTVAATVFLYLAPSGAYFKSMKQYRRAGKPGPVQG